MLTRLFTTTLLFFAVFAPAFAQKIKFNVNLNLGASRLYHNSDFKTTTLVNYYENIQEVFALRGIDYTWEDFAKDHKLRTTLVQPRFGFNAYISYKDWPVFLLAEAMSSTSDYTKMAYSGTIGMGRDFKPFDNEFYMTFLGGYKYVVDKGFGSNTIVNSVGDKSLRENLATFFGTVEPLGSNRGNLFVLRVGLGMPVGAGSTCIGAEAYGELDLTDKLKREARMTNTGVHLYVRFRFGHKSEFDTFYPNPAGGR